MSKPVLKNISLKKTALATVILGLLITPLMAAEQDQTTAPNTTAKTYPGHGYGMGPGMMGGYGMGPGMMGGYGMGPGLMGGYGMGPGMMGAWQALDLNDKQREQTAQIQKDLAKKQLDLQSQVADEYAKLQELYAAGKADPAATDKIYNTIADLRRQAMEARIDAHSKLQALLTEEQRDQLQRWQRGMMMGPNW